MGKVKKLFQAFASHKQNSLFSASLTLAITFGLSALLGFVRNRILYAQFFNCCVHQLDVYNAAFRLPDLIFKLLVTGALSASFIPVFSSYLHKDKEVAYKVASTVINLLVLVFTVISIVVFILAAPLSRIIAVGFDPGQIALMTDLTRILLVAQIFFLISNFFTGILQVNQAFILPSLSPIVYNLTVVASLFFLSPRFGIYGVTWGAVIGALLHLLIQLPGLKVHGFQYQPIIDLKLKGVAEIIRLMIPRSLSLGLSEIENTFILFLASTLPTGAISLLNLSIQIIFLPSRIFSTTVGQASLPILSKDMADNQTQKFAATVSRVIYQGLYLAIPVVIVVLVHRVAIIRLAYGSRQFPWSATLITARTLAFLAPTILFQAVSQILVRSFYAMHDTRTPLKISAVSLVSNVITGVFFIFYTKFGLVGLALSATIGNLVQSFLLVYYYTSKVKLHHLFLWTKAAAMIVSGLVMFFITWSSLQIFDLFILDTSRTLNLLLLFCLSSIMGLVSYYLCSVFFQLDEIKSIKIKIAGLTNFIFNS